MTQEKQQTPCTTIVIFGASGDLTQRKLIPALYNLYRKERLPSNVRILGYARRPYSHDDFRERLREGVEQFSQHSYDAELWSSFAQHVYYIQGDLNEPTDFENLEATLHEMEGDGNANRLYYLAVAPGLYATVTSHMAAAQMVQESMGERRLIIEKPFGHDLKSARELNAQLHEHFEEHQVYRIDHYLGKETAQNLIFFRFGNTVFETVWNRNYIDHVQITVAEQVDVGHRAGYYDQSGVLRDMFQNHLLQLLALVAMEPPASFSANAVRNETAKVLESIRPITDDCLTYHTTLAQYEGYRQADGVAPDSQTPTYAALRIFIDNWRWQGVPFYLRSGKALKEKVSEVVIQFRRPPHMLFPLPPGQELTPDILSVCVQPDEGIHFRFQAKVPDTVAEMRPVNMDFYYDSTFGPTSIPEAYERLLLDALNGDATLFIRNDTIELAWQFIDQIIGGWHQLAAAHMSTYQRGSWGPDEAVAMMAQDGRKWLYNCSH